MSPRGGRGYLSVMQAMLGDTLSLPFELPVWGWIFIPLLEWSLHNPFQGQPGCGG